MNEIILPAEVGELAVAAADHIASEALRLLIEDRRSVDTKRAYTAALRHFFASRGHAAPSPAAISEFFSLGAGGIATAMATYAATMKAANLSESTINQRLSAVRSLINMARRLGENLPDPCKLIVMERVQKHRDTRGPAVPEIRRLLEAPDQATVSGRRDYAILMFLWENALRRGEVCRLRVGDLELDGDPARAWILGKGKGLQKVAISLTERSVKAIRAMLTDRPDVAATSPLFVSVSNASQGHGLTGSGLYDIIDRHSRAALGKHIAPHKCRHSAITAFLNASGGDVRGAKDLSRHASLETLIKYDDNRRDDQGKASRLLSALA